MTMARRMAAQGLLALLVVATVAACGGDDGGTDVATLGEQTDDSSDAADDSTSDGSGEAMTDAEREDAMLEFTECMREHGVEMPDPEVRGGGGGGFAITNEVNGPEDAEEFEAAQEACGDILDDAFGDRPQLSPEEEAEMRDNMLAFAECMRDHGIDMPDPEFSSGEGGFTVRAEAAPGADGGGPRPDDPEFEEAQEACQGELGFEDGEGPGMVFRAGSTSDKS
jgi:hypothetical protein